jgi:hypothetical protein
VDRDIPIETFNSVSRFCLAALCCACSRLSDPLSDAALPEVIDFVPQSLVFSLFTVPCALLI